jgi:cobalt-zinc-cadmium efflux system outer membrane protein
MVMDRLSPGAALRFLGFLILFTSCLGCSSTRFGAILSGQSTAPNPVLLAKAEKVTPVAARAWQPKDKDGQKEMKEEEKNDAPKMKITLPMAIELCVTQNFRLLAGVEKVRQAEADLITAGLIPNSAFFTDYQLIPLQRVNLQNQLGPPQADAMVAVPIDWLLFGKRTAAKQAARLGIEVAQWDFTDLQRLQVSRTVDAFYETMMREGFLKQSLENHEELKKIEELTKTLVKAGKLDALEADRMKLVVLTAFLETHERDLALTAAKAKLRPLIGKSASDPDFELEGDLTVDIRLVPDHPPKLELLTALADAHRPDLKSDQWDIQQKRAVWELERRRAKPQMAVIPGWSYQNQHYISGFRNGSMFDIGFSTTLPITDRNQGNIRKAQSMYRESQQIYLANRADALAQVEATLDEYDDARHDVKLYNTPETLKAAQDMRKAMETNLRDGKRGVNDYLSAHQMYRQRLERVVEFEANYWRMLNKLNTVVGVHAFKNGGEAEQK